GDLLVSASSPNNDVHRFKVDGSPVGLFHNSSSLNFGEQLDHALNGDVLVAGFSSNNVVRLDPNTGALISSFAASGARGVHQLGNGNIMWTSGAGAFVFDVTSQQSTLIYQGSGRYVDVLNVPEPATGIVLASAMSLFAMRRRSRVNQDR
ncbi:MAG: PEP-CTERM sorting domain-containing protein, partial [Anaerolineae bacterium]|nr:PEP-CTERM sorting domain-containing protein [Phycisphaerae bacterium]